MKKYTHYLAVLLFFLSCTKEQGVPGPAGPQGPAGANGKGSASDTASIIGKVSLYDEFSNLQNDFSGVIVTLSSGSQQHNDTTGATGNFDFPGMTTGTYDLTYQKPGYGTMKVFGLSNFGGGSLPTQAGTVYMMQIPVKTAPNAFTLISNSPSATTFDIRLDTSSLQYVQIGQDFQVYISKRATVGPSDYDMILNTYNNPDGNGGYTVNFTKSPLILYIPPTITTGDTLYAVAYTYNFYVHLPQQPQAYTDWGPSSYYMDPQTGKYVYPNLSKPSNIVQFVY